MFASFLPEDVALAVVGQTTLIDQPEATLHPAEQALLSPNASAKRQRDFKLGRLAARKALAQLGCKPGTAPILQGIKGEPLWPGSVVGSISHAAGWAVCAAADRAAWRALGIDLIDCRRPMMKDIARHICTSTEATWIESNTEQAAHQLRLLFSAKESVFKAFYPICRCFISFRDVELAWNEPANFFCGTLQKDLSLELTAGLKFEVRATAENNFILTALLLGN